MTNIVQTGKKLCYLTDGISDLWIEIEFDIKNNTKEFRMLNSGKLNISKIKQQGFFASIHYENLGFGRVEGETMLSVILI